MVQILTQGIPPKFSFIIHSTPKSRIPWIKEVKEDFLWLHKFLVSLRRDLETNVTTQDDLRKDSLYLPIVLLPFLSYPSSYRNSISLSSKPPLKTLGWSLNEDVTLPTNDVCERWDWFQEKSDDVLLTGYVFCSVLTVLITNIGYCPPINQLFTGQTSRGPS